MAISDCHGLRNLDENRDERNVYNSDGMMKTVKNWAFSEFIEIYM